MLTGQLEPSPDTGTARQFIQAARNVSYPTAPQFNTPVSADSDFGTTSIGNLNNDTDIASSDLIARCQSIVPGDIVFIGQAHIGIIAWMDPIVVGMTKLQLENATHIIEATFDETVCYVVTDHTDNGVTNFYDAWRKNLVNGTLNSWLIVRLK
jgi:hypothetical protein